LAVQSEVSMFTLNKIISKHFLGRAGGSGGGAVASESDSSDDDDAGDE
jgi:hypothetical protein